MQKKDIIYEIYRDKRTVFSLNDIAQLIGETNINLLKQKINYYVKKGKLNNIRKGIYTKDMPEIDELACKIYKPSYISTETVLQKSGVIFQYYSSKTMVSYLSREIEVDFPGKQITISFRKIKYDVLLNNKGIISLPSGINEASPERAFLDTLYLMKDFYFDNINVLNKDKVYELLPIYKNGSLNKRVKKLLSKND